MVFSNELAKGSFSGFWRRFQHTAKRRRAAGVRPKIETLEDRLVLAFPDMNALLVPFTSHDALGQGAHHWHNLVNINIDGQSHPLPDDLNIVQPGDPIVSQGVQAGLYDIHTHAGDANKLHIEIPQQQFNMVHLGDVFTIASRTTGKEWIFNSQRLKYTDANGVDQDLRVDATHTLTMTVGGVPNTDFGNLVLTDPQQGGENLGPPIVINFTTVAPPPPPGTSQQFVTKCFTDLLGRAPDGNGMSFFSGMLGQNSTPDMRAQVALTVERSLEGRIKQCTDMYQRFLGRQPDPIGLNLSILWLGAGGSMEKLRETIMASPEAFQHSQSDPTTFANNLYQGALNRAPDPIGQGGVVGALLLGFNRRKLVDQVFESPEGKQAVVQNDYMEFLHRPADQSGLNTFTAVIQQGVSEDLVQAALVSSDENFNRM
jgi:hypothetical protein